MNNKYFLTLALAAVVAAIIAFLPDSTEVGRQIRIVGSSTVYPFTTTAAEEFGRKSDFRTPIVEATGTGGGFKLFCQGVGDEYPDFSNASRAIKDSEIELCAKNGVVGVTEIKLGYDGIVLANSKSSQRYDLTKEQIFKALAKKVPIDGKLVENHYNSWNEIDSSLPDKEIEIYGPPPTSGTRDAFVELVMEEACKDLPEFKKAYPKKKDRKKACHSMREDNRFIEAGENDNLIVQKLNANRDSLGIFGFSFLEQNLDSVQGSLIEGAEPSFENISNSSYSVSRPLFVYAKNAHIGVINGMQEFIFELTSEDAMGEEGYLADKGMIPLPIEEFKKVRTNARGAK